MIPHSSFQVIYGRVYGPDMDDPDMWYHVGQVQLGGVIVLKGCRT
jgi:hypothetical protein